MHRLTHAFALALSRASDPAEHDVVAAGIDDITRGYPDEQKADLYALIAESVRPGMPFAALCEALDKALTNNERTFIRG